MFIDYIDKLPITKGNEEILSKWYDEFKRIVEENMLTVVTVKVTKTVVKKTTDRAFSVF